METYNQNNKGYTLDSQFPDLTMMKQNPKS